MERSSFLRYLGLVTLAGLCTAQFPTTDFTGIPYAAPGNVYRGNPLLQRIGFLGGLQEKRSFIDQHIALQKEQAINSISLYVHPGLTRVTEVKVQIWETPSLASQTFTLTWEHTIAIPANYPLGTGRGGILTVDLGDPFEIPTIGNEYYLGWTYVDNGPISFDFDCNYQIHQHVIQNGNSPTIGVSYFFGTMIPMKPSIGVSTGKGRMPPPPECCSEPGPPGPRGLTGPQGPPGQFKASCDAHDCEHLCIPSLSSKGYTCMCRPGYKLNEDERTCRDDNECAVENGRCEHICTNVPGTAICSCRTGYQLSPDKHECLDIDECLVTDCTGICVNTVGSYHCLRLFGIHPHPQQFPGLQGLIGRNSTEELLQEEDYFMSKESMTWVRTQMQYLLIWLGALSFFLLGTIIILVSWWCCVRRRLSEVEMRTEKGNMFYGHSNLMAVNSGSTMTLDDDAYSKVSDTSAPKTRF